MKVFKNIFKKKNKQAKRYLNDLLDGLDTDGDVLLSDKIFLGPYVFENQYTLINENNAKEFKTLINAVSDAIVSFMTNNQQSVIKIYAGRYTPIIIYELHNIKECVAANMQLLDLYADEKCDSIRSNRDLFNKKYKEKLDYLIETKWGEDIKEN